MTPLFAATQASQSVAMEQSLVGSGASVNLRATQQALAFTPTQGQSPQGFIVTILSLLLIA